MGHAAREYFAHRSQIFTETVRTAFIKKHETRRSPTDRRGGNCTDAHGWVFSRIVYSCSAAYCLGFDAPPAQRIATDFSHAENLSMRARFSGHAPKGKSTETERVMFTFALTGRGMIGCGGLPRATLRLPWAMEVIGLSAHLGCQGYALPWAFSPQGSTGLCATIVFSARLD